ncbi:DNA-binding response regulator [Pseudobutyrivibrio ruminis]|uniref:Stage 0 sporulation protein A homolog n=2 Tax=Pseudobutyrivibrio ruminis TaxID=46206 RepID=A0A2G3DT06_9FIRM|nr:DNA-binding response regulator [Pseudobutyrivibrio ruminis]
MMKNILIAEDSKEIVDVIRLYLEANDVKIIEVNSGKQAMDVFNKMQIHLVLLDIMLPEMNGYEVIKEIRKKSNIPIIFMSAKGQDEDKILGLNLGADDYIVKPFNPLELTARVSAQLRRFYSLGASSDTSLEQIKINNLVLDQRECKLFMDGNEIELTYMEYKLLKLLMNEPGRVFTKSQIFENVWDEEYSYADNTVTVYISKLREKIEVDSKNPKLIKTVRGLGYKFEKANN